MLRKEGVTDLSKYGWPFLLFIGVPFFARVFAPIVAEFYTVGSGLSGLHDFTLLESGAAGLGDSRAAGAPLFWGA